MEQEKVEHHLVPYSVYWKIWLALIVLTGITVGASYLEMQKFSLFTAMLIATVKATLVILYFMHIRYDKPIFLIMILVLLVTYAVFVLLTFVDYWYRVPMV